MIEDKILVALNKNLTRSFACGHYTSDIAGNSNMSREFKEHLIATIQEWPCVYNHHRSDFKDSVKKDNAWGAIAFACCSDG